MMIMDEEKSWRELPFQPEGLETGGPLKAWSPINPPDTTPGYLRRPVHSGPSMPAA